VHQDDQGWTTASVGNACSGSSLELRADTVSVGVADFVEDIERLLPGLPGPIEVARAVVGVTDLAEDDRDAVAVAEVAADGESLFVAVGGFSVVAEVVVGVAEAVPGGGLQLAVADLL
jgi:hypothetical protein